jgi:hypothetical protein
VTGPFDFKVLEGVSRWIPEWTAALGFSPDECETAWHTQDEPSKRGEFRTLVTSAAP